MSSFGRQNGSYDPMSSFGNSDGKSGGDNVQLLDYKATGTAQQSPHKRNGQADRGTMEERENFLNSTPVKLDPGWDSLHRTNGDDLLLHKKPIEEMERMEPEPIDRYRIVFFIMMIHGVGILMPWNMFITAKAYFEDYKLNTTISYKADYRSNFMFYLGIASQVANAVISAMNTFCQFGGQASTSRIAIAIFSMVVIFIVTVVLAMIDSAAWPFEFFIITMVSVILLNCSAGVYQNSVFGQAAILPMKFTNAVVLGNNLCGIFTSVINIISIAASPNPRTAAVYYFIVAIVILLLAFDAYFMLPLTKFYQFYLRKVKVHSAVVQEDNSCSHYVSMFWQSCKMYGRVFKKIWVQILCIWWVFCVSLTCFPGIQSNIRSLNNIIGDTYWAPVFCFLCFNFFAFVGNMVSEWIKWPSAKWVWIPVLVRGLFIPFFLLCNFIPPSSERTIPVYIENDYIYIVGAVLMAFTSGYYSSLCMMYGPRLVEPDLAGRAGMMMAFFLVLGITSGVNLSLALSKIFIRDIVEESLAANTTIATVLSTLAP